MSALLYTIERQKKENKSTEEVGEMKHTLCLETRNEQQKKTAVRKSCNLVKRLLIVRRGRLCDTCTIKDLVLLWWRTGLLPAAEGSNGRHHDTADADRNPAWWRRTHVGYLLVQCGIGGRG